MRRQTITGGGRECRMFTTHLALTEVDTTLGFTHMSGRACPYGVYASRYFFMEGFAEGLFDKSIKEAAAGLPLLIFHDDRTWPIGHATEWQSTPDGLDGVWALDDSAEAQRAAKLAKAGHLPYMSVGYIPLQSTWEFSESEDWDPSDSTTLDRCLRTEARLLETSTVSVPHFKEAEIKLVRSAETTTRPQRHAEPYPNLARWRKIRSSL